MAMSQETKDRRAAARKREKELSKLESVANDVQVLEGGYVQWVHPVYAVRLVGQVEEINPVLEKLGYRPIRLTRNMLNDKSPTFAIDINTPSYCDPGSEAYHSM